ncbi:hypothetical protein ACQ4PT_004013 [Festuca glaucescens]
MQLRRLLGLSVSGSLRRSLCTAATPPPDSARSQGWSWYMLGKMAAAVGLSPSPYVVFGNTPRISDLYMPQQLAKTRGLPEPDPEGEIVRVSAGQACSASQDGFLLLSCQDILFTAPVIAKQGSNKMRDVTGLAEPDRVPDIAHVVFNPLTGQLCHLPAIQGPKKILAGFNLGLLTQTKADGNRGPPDRYAVAELDGNANVMLRFLSGTRDWDLVKCSPFQLPAQRRMMPTQEVVAFRGHLWWVDVAWGAICADPFSHRPEPRFIELPSGSVLPADTDDEAFRRASLLPDAEGNMWWMQEPAMYRRVGINGGWLRYVEVSEEEPFVLSSFALNADGSGWTLEHRVVVSRLWANGGFPWLPLQGETRPKIGALDLAKTNVVHLIVGNHIVVADIHKGEVLGHCPREGDICILPCVLSPWLAASPIPSA